MISSPIGGCTFAEDPDHSCARVRPLWSAAVDPCVLGARAERALASDIQVFDAYAPGVRVVRSACAEHVLVARSGQCIRIDIDEGSVMAPPVCLRFGIVHDDRFAAQIAAISLFGGLAPGRRQVKDPMRPLLALAALDARRAGASLRETADLVLGRAEWPGDGEHRKSHVRRLIAAGEQMVAAGPRPILTNLLL